MRNFISNQARRLLPVLLLLCPPIAPMAWAEAVPSRPQVALVLSGGGARGVAHVGVLQVLEELQVPVDIIVGTSMGALIGGFYASGMSADEISQMVSQMNWARMFSGQAERAERAFRRKREDELGLPGPKLGLTGSGLVLADAMLSGQHVELFIQRQLVARNPQRDFDALPIRFRALAADLVSGDAVVLDQGDMARAMRASMSLPGVFSPVRLDHQLLVDGGIANNLPVDVAIAMGADIIIAVDVAVALHEERGIQDLTNVSEQISRLLVYRNTQQQIQLLRPQDILLQPALGEEINSADFDTATASIPLGAAAAWAATEKLQTLSLSSQDYQAYRQQISIDQGRLLQLPVRQIKLSNQSAYADALILAKLAVQLDEPLDISSLQAAIDRIYAAGYFKQVAFQLEPVEQHLILHIEAAPDIRTPHLLEYGLTLQGNGSDNRFGLRLGYLRTHVDPRRLGGEWRILAESGDYTALSTELYLPLDARQHWFLLPRAYGFRHNLDRYNLDGFALGQVQDARMGLALAAGFEFNPQWVLLAGTEFYKGRLSLSRGAPLIDNYRFQGGELFLDLRRDSLDDRYLPGRGSVAQLRWVGSRPGLGADDNFDQLSVQYLRSLPWRRQVLTLSLKSNLSLQDAAPPHARFPLGGFGNLSGLRHNELFGQQTAVIGLDMRRRLFTSSFLPGFLGLLVEYGNAWDDLDAMDFDDGIVSAALYFGYRSPLGPFVFGYAQAEARSGLFYLDLGRRF